MTTENPQFDPRQLVHDIAARTTIAVGMAAIAVIHLLDSVSKYHETRYLFWMYIALIGGSTLVAGFVLFTRSRSALFAAAFLAAGAAVGYVLSRSTGLPQASGDIGNWTEPLGLASLFVEGAVVAVVLAALVTTRRPQVRSVAASSGSRQVQTA